MKVVDCTIMPVHAAIPVRHVADERVIRMPQVAPHLVQTASLRHRTHERAAVHGGVRDEAIARQRRHALAVLAFWNRVVHDALGGRLSAHEREVSLLDALLGEVTHERGGGLLVTREEERAARAAVEAVKRVNVRAAERVANTKHRDVVVVVPSAMHQEPGWLVGNDDVVVHVKKLDLGHGRVPTMARDFTLTPRTRPHDLPFMARSMAGYSAAKRRGKRRRVAQGGFMLSRRAFTLAAASLALSTTGVTGCDKKSDDIPIGAYLSLSGSDSTFGTDTRDGIELALTETNAAGGVRGKKVKVTYEDDKSTPQEASNKVRQLIDRDGVLAVLGEVASSRSMAGGLIANSKKVPMVTPSSTAVEVTQGREYVFRVCFTDDQQGNAAARFVWDTLKKKNVAVFYAAQDNYSSGLAKAFKESFQKLGGTIAIDTGYQKGETNFTTYLSKIKEAKPDLIYVPNYYNDMVQIARQAKQLDLPGSMFMGGDGWDSADLIEGAGAELEGAYLTDHYAPDSPRAGAAAFATAFKGKYGRDPSSLTAQAYDAAKLLFDAIGRATELTPEAIKNALAATKDFQGATGNLTIDKNHNANKPIVVVQVKGKKFTYTTQLMSQ